MTRHLARGFFLGLAYDHARYAALHASDALTMLWLAARATDERVVVAPRGGREAWTQAGGDA